VRDPALVSKESNNQGPYRHLTQLLLGKVVAFHPAQGTADVALTNVAAGGGFYRNVPVLSWVMGTQVGESYYPRVDAALPLADPSGPYDVPLPSGQADVWCVVGHVLGRSRSPAILGFLPPQTSEVLHASEGLRVGLHESGVYWVTTSGAHDERHYPDGTAIIVGPDTEPYDMAAENPSWKPPTTGALNYTVLHSTGARLQITSTGAVNVEAASGQQVTLGTGSPAPVARKGDPITVTVGGTQYTGEISEGSAEVQSA